MTQIHIFKEQIHSLNKLEKEVNIWLHDKAYSINVISTSTVFTKSQLIITITYTTKNS